MEKLLKFVIILLAMGFVMSTLTRKEKAKVMWDKNKPSMKTCKQYSSLRFRRICQRLAKDPVIKQMDQMDPEAVLQDANIGQRTFGPDPCLACPSAKDIINPLSKNNIRTTSPWAYCLDYNPLRFPEYLNFGKCSNCLGCFDLKTKQFDPSLTPKSMTVQISVIFRDNTSIPFHKCEENAGCKEQLIDVPVGCYCGIPETIKLF